MKTHQLRLTGYMPDDSFVGRLQRLVRDTMIPYQYDVLHDRADGAEKSHVVTNFINAAKVLRGESDNSEDGGFYGMVFQDSDAAKWIEAAAYSLALFPSERLEADADRLIDIIAAAQDEDGYLDTAFTIKDRDRRWTNLLEGHELYCMGHMMEAACAYYEAMGKDKLLGVMEKNAEHIYKVFITDGHEGFPGHPEVELALLRLYRVTNNPHFLELSKRFIDTRGTDPDYYRRERKARDWTVWGNNAEDNTYQQSGVPLRKASVAEGHAVRAVYLYTGMADLAAETGDEELYAACRRLWESITRRRMYITGGIGSTNIGEAFTVDYDLPSDTAYCETCASVGLIFFASKMLEASPCGEYADVMERAFYNTVLAGIQLDGKRFFYVNPLECIPGISGKAATHPHTLTQRPGWYACACCPPNAARLISSLGKYAYGESGETAFVHLYAGGTVSFDNGIKLSCVTEYPYDFTVSCTVLEGSGTLALRIPGWSEKYSLVLNGKLVGSTPDNGYIYTAVKSGDEIRLELDGTPRFVYPSAGIPQLSGSAAVCRGPLVYCFEGADNGGDVISLSLVRNGEITVTKADGLPGDITALSADAVRESTAEGLYSFEEPVRTPCKAVAVPYYSWCNRGENQMRVWMNLE